MMNKVIVTGILAALPTHFLGCLCSWDPQLPWDDSMWICW